MSHFFLNACSDVARKTAWVVLLMHAKNAADRNDPISCFLHTELRLVQTDCVKRSGIESFLTPCVFRMRKNRTTLLRKRMRFTQV